MRYFYQDGPFTSRDEFELSLDAEVSYAGVWNSLNDHTNFRLHAEGFGRYDQTHRRKTVSSEFYSGDYQVRVVKESPKFTWQVMCMGESQSELEENVESLLTWFRQDSFNVRVKKNEVVTTYLADCADFTVDASHVNMHNCRCHVTLSFSTHPTSQKEIWL